MHYSSDNLQHYLHNNLLGRQVHHYQHHSKRQQTISLHGMKILRDRVGKDEVREIVAKVTIPEESVIATNFVLHLSTAPLPQFVPKVDVLSSERRLLYLSEDAQLAVAHEELIKTTQELTKNEIEPQAQFKKLFEYVFKQIKTVEDGSYSDIQQVLNFNRGTVLGKAKLLTSMARIAKIPARLVTGFKLEESSDLSLFYWVEAHFDNHWESFDPSDGYVRELPNFYVPIRKNSESIVILPEGVEIVIGGRGAVNYQKIIDRIKARFFSNLVDFRRYLSARLSK